MMRPLRRPLGLALALCGVAGPVLAQPALDAVSDRVGATAGQFRVDESGSATYQVPIYTPPGTAGVVPQLALVYSSQGGNGPLGRGWAISGTSAISRCRATREHGDFLVGGVPVDGDASPVNFSSSDRFCLDGQRLIPAAPTAPACRTVSGATVAQLRTEIESFQRVCAYTFSAADGPRFFTVERKDGSMSWYGDRDASTTAAVGNRTDAVVDSNAAATLGRILSWSQTRFMDSTGNYIDYVYLRDPYGTEAPGEQVLSEVRWTGKLVLPGQTGTASAPYARVTFNYAQAFWQVGYLAGSTHTQTQRLNSITVTNGSTVVRHYALTYALSPSGSGATTLTQVQECRDASLATCYRPTSFEWSLARHEFAPGTAVPDVGWGSAEDFRGMKFADLDGDGRQDIVGCCTATTARATRCAPSTRASMPTATRTTPRWAAATCARRATCTATRGMPAGS
jgi:hypothetical protein